MKQNWDFYWDEAYDDDPPDLNDDGEAFYVFYSQFDDMGTANRTKTFLCLNEADHWIGEMLKQVEWDEDPN